MPKPIMEGQAIMKSPLVVHGWCVLLLDFSNNLFYWKAKGDIGSYAGLYMVSILGLVSL